jgi:branched-chain amino acid transport system permease protein
MDMKRDYDEDIQLLDGKVLWFWFLMLSASLAILPFLIPNYYIYMVNYMAINVIVNVNNFSNTPSLHYSNTPGKCRESYL